MYAVVRTGGKQYRVEPGALVDIEKIPGEVGQSVELADVLLVGKEDKVIIGQPTIKGAVVTAQILEQKKGRKCIIFKKIRRHGYHLKKGHRQQLTRIQIAEIRA